MSVCLGKRFAAGLSSQARLMAMNAPPGIVAGRPADLSSACLVRCVLVRYCAASHAARTLATATLSAPSLARPTSLLWSHALSAVEDSSIKEKVSQSVTLRFASVACTSRRTFRSLKVALSELSSLAMAAAYCLLESCGTGMLTGAARADCEICQNFGARAKIANFLIRPRMESSKSSTKDL